MTGATLVPKGLMLAIDAVRAGTSEALLHYVVIFGVCLLASCWLVQLWMGGRRKLKRQPQ